MTRSSKVSMEQHEGDEEHEVKIAAASAHHNEHIKSQDRWFERFPLVGI